MFSSQRGAGHPRRRGGSRRPGRIWFLDAAAELIDRVTESRGVRGATDRSGGLYGFEVFATDRGPATAFVPLAGEGSAPPGRARGFTVPAAELVVIRHRGPHDDVDLAYSELGAYATRHEISGRAPLREYYWTASSGTPRTRRSWMTDLCWPVFLVRSVGIVSAALSLDGRRALVTGGSKGAGAAVVARLRAAGAPTSPPWPATVPSDADGSVNFVARGSHHPGRWRPHRRRPRRSATGGSDILVHVAGGSSSPAGGFATLTDDDWADELNRNLLGASAWTAALIPAMIECWLGAPSCTSRRSSAGCRSATARSVTPQRRPRCTPTARGWPPKSAPKGVRVNMVVARLHPDQCRRCARRADRRRRGTAGRSARTADGLAGRHPARPPRGARGGRRGGRVLGVRCRAIGGGERTSWSTAARCRPSDDPRRRHTSPVAQRLGGVEPEYRQSSCQRFEFVGRAVDDEATAFGEPDTDRHLLRERAQHRPRLLGGEFDDPDLPRPTAPAERAHACRAGVRCPVGTGIARRRCRARLRVRRASSGCCAVGRTCGRAP